MQLSLASTNTIEQLVEYAHDWPTFAELKYCHNSLQHVLFTAVAETPRQRSGGRFQ